LLSVLPQRPHAHWPGGQCPQLPGEQRPLLWSGTSRAGLRSKKLFGTSRKLATSAGMTGQSSDRGMCVTPTVRHSTMSVFSTGRLAAVQAGSPAPERSPFGCSPAERTSSGEYGVTQTLRVANPARYLFKLFAAEDTTVSGWIRQRRLERCARDLADPAARYQPIGLIAARWGLLDARHFARLFKTAYGHTPREYRQMTLEGGSRR
jgi:hypothetical protein